MKQNFKTYFKLLVFLFSISLTTNNCQKDDDLSNTETSKTKSYKTVSLNEVLKLKPIVENIKKVRPISSSINAKTGETFLGLDNVLTDQIIQITNSSNSSTYTFGVDTSFETSGYIENLHLVETGQDYIAYIIRYIPDANWATNIENYTPEGDLVLDLSTFQGHKIKYTLDREVIWTTIPPDNTRGVWSEVCTLSLVETCDYGGTLHQRGPDCGGTYGVGEMETCVSVYTGGGTSSDIYDNDGSANGGGNPSNNNCIQVSGTLIQNSQPISGMDTGCTNNEVTGLEVGDIGSFSLWDDCSVSTETLNSSYSLLSPFEVDLSSVRQPCGRSSIDTTFVAANAKFMCIYNKLANSPKFKTLFIDTFGEEDNNMNIKFEIGDLLQPNGFRPDGKTISNTLDVREQTIILDEGLLNSNHPLIVAQTIIHEALHAFINVKQVECIPSPNSTTTYDYINSLNQLTFEELINDFYLDCDVNQPVQHRLMYNRMVDAMDEMLAEVFTNLVALDDQDLTNNPQYMYPDLSGPAHAFNWPDAFHYINLGGLQEATEYSEDVQQDPTILFFVGKYNLFLNDSNRFIQNTCND